MSIASSTARSLASPVASSVAASSGGVSWSVIPKPAIDGYALLTHDQKLYYDGNLGGYAFRPYSLYTDTGGTTLATAAGDLIARWDDETTESGLSMRQATAANRPTLQFEKNSAGIFVPVVRSARATDKLVSNENVSVWASKRGGAYAVYKPRTSLVKNPIGWNFQAWFYSWYPWRFYDGGFAGATNGFDNKLVKTAIIRTSDTNRAQYQDGVLVDNTSGSDSAAISQPLQMPMNDDWIGDYCGLIYSTSGTFDSSIDNFLSSVAPAYEDKPNVVVCDGNSLTIGSGATNPLGSYPDQLQSLLAGWTVKNVGIASQQTPAMISAAATRVDPLFSTATKKVTVCWEATNHLFFGATAATAYDSLVTYCEARRSAGQQVVVVTVLPRSDTSTPGTFEADRQTVNTSIRNNWETFADALADVAADNRIGDEGDELDTDYYHTDKVHMNATGYGIVAGIVKSAIDTL